MQGLRYDRWRSLWLDSTGGVRSRIHARGIRFLTMVYNRLPSNFLGRTYTCFRCSPDRNCRISRYFRFRLYGLFDTELHYWCDESIAATG